MAEDDEWRFAVDEVGPDDPEADEVGPDDPEADEGASDGEADDEGGGGFDVEMVGEDDDGPTVAIAADDSGEGEEGGNVAGSLVPDRTIEPGTPDLENVVFTTAGAVLTALVLAAVLVPLDPVTIVGIAGGISAVSGVLYALFLRF